MKIFQNISLIHFVKEFLSSFFYSASYIIINKNYWIGFFFFLFLCFYPSKLLLVITAFLTTVIAGRLIKINRYKEIENIFIYNSILTGLLVGHFYQISLLIVVLTIIVSIFTLLLSYALSHFLYHYFNLPLLNLPYTIVAILFYLASSHYTNLLIVNSASLNSALFNFFDLSFLPVYISGLLEALGALIFIPQKFIGLILLIVIFCFSKINFFLVILGYYCGTLFLWGLTGNFFGSFQNPYAFNFILISLSLGGVFLIPSIYSYLIALVGVLLSTFILDATIVFWSSFSLPVFTFPFVFVTLLTLYVLKLSHFPYMTKVFMSNPEANLEHYLTYQKRFQIVPQIFLPFNGEWKVYQEFDDIWTHQGSWRHGIDFVISNKITGKNYRNQGLYLEDYFCFNKPIVSPISGVIVNLYNQCADNNIGKTNVINNWGNYVIIYNSLGYYVEISHFKQNSITVHEGQTVEKGQVLGMCGNSGNSPEPHIHIQCQLLSTLGAPTIPYYFTNATLENNKWLKSEYLKREQFLNPILPSINLQNKINFILEDEFTFVTSTSDKQHLKARNKLFLKVFMNHLGYYYLYDKKTNSQLFFHQSSEQFNFVYFNGNKQSYLKYFLMALPSLPLTSSKVNWEDNLNPYILKNYNHYYSLLKSFSHSLFTIKGEYQFINENTVEGKIFLKSWQKRLIGKTQLVFDNHKGISKIYISLNKKKITIEKSIVEL